MQENTSREAVLAEIVERELAMFLATNNEGGVSVCQTRPETFRAMRKMSHSAHDEALLVSYLDDLRQAELHGRNFMVEKYARMDDRLPPLSTSPLLDQIADAEEAFLQDAQRRYPHVIKSNGQGMFRRYLRCELETLSSRTLELYAVQVSRAQHEGRNLVVERHDYLMRLLGKGGIDACNTAGDATGSAADMGKKQEH
ncbi:DUF4125 family protein [Desulfovibrio sp.]|uniref:DUF4125 family protein n=1 Tax=Desulfovibrio sp. TaxID=885 RepID=UPI0025C4A995|nr:DUF4125 family protein [Desulfovibrio sp.]